MTDTCGNDSFALFLHSTYIWEHRDLFERAVLAEWLRENEAF